MTQLTFRSRAAVWFAIWGPLLLNNGIQMARSEEALQNTELCCALISLAESAQRLPTDSAREPFADGLVIASPSKLIELDHRLLATLKKNATVRETFHAFGVGMLLLRSHRIEWYFDDNTVYSITLNSSIDIPPRTVRRHHSSANPEADNPD